MKIVVLGDGLLGSEIVKQTQWDLISRKKDSFDITDYNSFPIFFLENFDGVIFTPKYDCILNCIAATNTYSSDKESNWNVNFKAVSELVDFCNKWSIKLIHISTDYVYTNSISNAKETDIPIHGNNWYSYTKLLGDSYIELKSKNYLICRGTHKPYPFPYENAWTDIATNCDYVNVIADIIIKLIKTNSTGIFNVGTETKTVFELAKKTRNVNPIKKPDCVPNDTTMDVSKLKKILNDY